VHFDELPKLTLTSSYEGAFSKHTHTHSMHITYCLVLSSQNQRHLSLICFQSVRVAYSVR